MSDRATTTTHVSRAAATADAAVQRLADVTVWLIFRLSRVRS